MIKKYVLITALTVGVQLCSAVDPGRLYADRKAPSTDAPVENPPMLIALSSDDNYNIEGMLWMINTLETRKHVDSSNLRMSFYCNTGFLGNSRSYVDALYATFLQAYKMGNEVSSHTATHPFCVNGEERLSDREILAELNQSIDDLVSIGIKREHMYGFRTPYVAYTDSTFIAVKQAGFTYDASLSDAADGNYHWPYTLDTKNSFNLNDNGLENPPESWDEETDGPSPEPIEPSFAPGNHLSLSYNNYTNRTPVRKHSGLWEIPLYTLQVPDSLIPPLDSALGYGSKGLVLPTIEGLIQEGDFTKEQTLETLKHQFKEIYNGNRAPMVVVFHTPNFSTTNNIFNETYLKCSDPLDRQWIVEQFIDFALAKEDVWFVSGEQVINYCKNPVPADEFKPDEYSSIPIDTTNATAIHTRAKPVSHRGVSLVNRNLHLSLANVTSATITICNLRGQEIAPAKQVQLTDGKGIVPLDGLSAKGVYLASIQTESQTLIHKFSID